MCSVSAFLLPSSLLIYLILVNAQGTVLRVYLLNKPPGVADRIPQRHLYCSMALCGALALGPDLVFALFGGRKTKFMSHRLHCGVELGEGFDGYYTYLIVVVTIPLVVLVTANIYAGFMIRKSLSASRTVTKVQKCRVCLTIQAICGSFIIAYLPIIVVLVLKLAGVVKQETAWLLIPTFCLSLTALSNPFIMYLSNVKFRGYVRGLLGLSKEAEQKVKVEMDMTTSKQGSHSKAVTEKTVDS